MKHSSMKHILLAFCFLMSMSSLAQSATVDGLKYVFQGNAAAITGYDETTLPENLVIPETVEYNGLTFNVIGINNNAFFACSIIKTLKTTHRLSYISNAFSGCNNLQTIDISAKRIGGDAFSGCNNLQTIDISAEEIGKQAFYNCQNLKTAKVSGEIIRSQAFEGCGLESVILDGVVEIYDNVFYNCSNLKWIDFGNSLERIGSKAFWLCI